MTNSIESIRTNHPNLSLKRICEVTGVCYQYVLKASKKPIAGKPYDPTDFNTEEVDKIFARKNVDFESYDWQTIADEMKIIVPISKIEDFDVGTEFQLRENEENKGTIYSVVFTTESHVVFMSHESTQPRVMNWSTFMHQSPRIEK
jgi:hypothetical protein